jgi:hypothetical protein
MLLPHSRRLRCETPSFFEAYPTFAQPLDSTRAAKAHHGVPAFLPPLFGALLDLIGVMERVASCNGAKESSIKWEFSFPNSDLKSTCTLLSQLDPKAPKPVVTAG